MKKINVPELNDSIIGWIYNTSYTNLPSLNKLYDFEDLVQDGLMIAIKCRIRYGYDIDPAHFTSLVKTSFTNHIIDLKRKKSRLPEFVDIDEIETVEPSEQELVCTLNELPEPVKAVLRLFLSLDTLRKLRMPMRATLTETETPAKRLKRLAGWPEDKDFENELKKLLLAG